MASLDFNLVGLVFILDHEDAQALANSGPEFAVTAVSVIGPALVAAAVAAPIAAAVTAAVAGYIAIQGQAIKAVDRGFGVYLTLPWPAVYSGMLFLIIPTTRPEVGLGKGWGNTDSGTFKTEDAADLIRYHIDHEANGADSIGFRLVLAHSSSGWEKEILLPDGDGNVWQMKPNGKGSEASTGLWTGQEKRHQVMTFRKPKAAGIWYTVAEFGFLEDLKGGDRVTFVWERD
jgi:hypothetical protein